MDYKQLDTIKFFGSKTRLSLLVEFILSAKDRFFMRELERNLNIPIGNVRRELLMLEKNGILKSERIGNLKFFSLNYQNPIYHSLRDIIVKTAGIPKLLQSFIVPNKDIIFSFIYGSYAKRELDSSSDIDLFIVTKKNDNLFEDLNLELEKLEKRFGREISTDIMNHGDYKKQKEEKNPYILDIISGKKIFIKGGKDEL